MLHLYSLVLGCPDGRLKEALDKLLAVEAKNGPFSAGFVLGGPPSDDESDISGLFDFVKRDLQVKFPCYFVSGPSRSHVLEDSLIEELALRNIHFCRPHGILKTVEGLVVAFVSGVEAAQHGGDRDIALDAHDIDRLEEEYLKDGIATVDMMLSWSWPAGVVSPTPRNVPCSRLLRRLAQSMKPRYIFTPSHDPSVYLERQPYENVDAGRGEFMYATRFISLAPCLNAADKKWIYALSLTPARFMNVAELAKRPDSCTKNPFAVKEEEESDPDAHDENYFYGAVEGVGTKRKPEPSGSQPVKRPPSGYICKRCHGNDHFFRDCKYTGNDAYVCHICQEPGHHIRNCPKRSIPGPDASLKQVVPEACWFCLGNPASRKHLIISVGERMYLTLAKGPLNSKHLLIIPIDHVAGDTLDMATEFCQEVLSTKRKIHDALEGEGLVPVYFRLNQNASHHWHEQMIPIPKSRSAEFLEFLAAFALPLGFDFKPKSESDAFQECFFEFSLEDEGCLRHYFDRKSFFPAQFGRQVLGAFLNINDGMARDWKQAQSEEAERQFVAEWKKCLQ